VDRNKLKPPMAVSSLPTEFVAEQAPLAVKVHTLTEVIGFIHKFAESCHGMVHDSPVFELCTRLNRQVCPAFTKVNSLQFCAYVLCGEEIPCYNSFL